VLLDPLEDTPVSRAFVGLAEMRLAPAMGRAAQASDFSELTVCFTGAGDVALLDPLEDAQRPSLPVRRDERQPLF
jgi:hypothetical protein